MQESNPHAPGQRGLLIWLTGLSGAGKTTLAQALHQYFSGLPQPAILLDGDILRRGLCADLGFSPRDRAENMRRVGHVAELFLQQGFLVLAAFISPLEQDRTCVRRIVGEASMLEVYLRCSLVECERRDVKGLYRRARAGEVTAFTGISAPYEVPQTPHLVLDTEHLDLTSCLQQAVTAIQARLHA